MRFASHVTHDYLEEEPGMLEGLFTRFTNDPLTDDLFVKSLRYFFHHATATVSRCIRTNFCGFLIFDFLFGDIF